MRNYFQIAQADPGNSRIDLAPINNALSNIRQNQYQNALMERRDAETAYQQGRDQKQDARQAESDKWARAERAGKIADAVEQLQGPQRQAAWQRVLTQFGSDDMTPEERDPMTGPALLRAQAGMYRDPREDRLMDLKLRGAELDVAKAARGPAPEYRTVGDALLELPPGGAPREVYREPPKPDPVKDMLLERMRRGRGGPSAVTGAPGVSPMSYQGGAQPPGVTLIDDRPTPEAPAVAPPDTVDTPFGAMSRDEARELGGAMLLDPKYAAAGKALLDSVGGDSAGLSKPAQTQLDERTISAASSLGRLQEIRRQSKAKFQQIPSKLKLMGASWGASLGAPLSPEMTKDLGDFARYKVTAYDNFNQLLKELSGTAVSAQELARQKIVQPNPGEGIFDGDDPVTFEAKIDQGERVSRMAIARMNFMRSRGVAFNKETAEQFLRLEDVPAAIDRRGAEIEAELKRANPGADPMSIEREAESRVRREFGI